MNFRASKAADCVFGGHYTLSDDKVSLRYMPDSWQIYILQISHISLFNSTSIINFDLMHAFKQTFYLPVYFSIA